MKKPGHQTNSPLGTACIPFSRIPSGAQPQLPWALFLPMLRADRTSKPKFFPSLRSSRQTGQHQRRAHQQALSSYRLSKQLFLTCDRICRTPFYMIANMKSEITNLQPRTINGAATVTERPAIFSVLQFAFAFVPFAPFCFKICSHCVPRVHTLFRTVRITKQPCSCQQVSLEQGHQRLPPKVHSHYSPYFMGGGAPSSSAADSVPFGCVAALLRFCSNRRRQPSRDWIR